MSCIVVLKLLKIDERRKKTALDEVDSEYHTVVSLSENHLQIDYFQAIVQLYLASSTDSIDPKPNKYIYTIVFGHFVTRVFSVITLYSFPVILFYFVVTL